MYQFTRSGLFIRRLTDNADIPIQPGERDYENYLAWAAIPGNITESVPPFTAEELAAQAQHQKDIADIAEAKTYTKLRALQDMTPTQIQTWATNNVTNLAQARDAITTLAIAVSILSRRL